MSTQTTSQEKAMSQSLNAPAGYELNEDSSTPVWFGPVFEGQSFAQWDPAGYEVVLISGGDYVTGPITLDAARELRRNLDGILALIGEAA